MKILALDLGTQLGWARQDENGFLSACTLVLAGAGDLRYAKKLRMDRRLDIRVAAFTDWLWNLPKHDWVIFEDVRFASSQAQAHLWASFRGVLWAYAHRTGAQIECLDTGKLKKWMTGTGGADKPAMRTATFKRWPGHSHSTWDDNAVDAFCLLQWARETIKV